MSANETKTELPPLDGRREVATILAKGVLRLRRLGRIGEITPNPECQDSPGNGLEVAAETRLSVADPTRGLRLRDDGDDG